MVIFVLVVSILEEGNNGIFNEFNKKEKPFFTGIARGALLLFYCVWSSGGDAYSSDGVSITSGTKTTNGTATVDTFLSSGSLVLVVRHKKRFNICSLLAVAAVERVII